MSAAPSLSYVDVLKALATAGVDFVVCGGAACVLHGIQRITHDIDLSVEMSPDNLKRLVAAVSSLKMQPRSPEPLAALLDPSRRQSWIVEKQANVFTLVSQDGLFQVDVFLRYPIPHADLKSRSQRITRGDLSFLISSKQDLIYAKSQVEPKRVQDARDIEDLKALIDRESRNRNEP